MYLAQFEMAIKCLHNNVEQKKKRMDGERWEHYPLNRAGIKKIYEAKYGPGNAVKQSKYIMSYLSDYKFRCEMREMLIMNKYPMEMVVELMMTTGLQNEDQKIRKDRVSSVLLLRYRGMPHIDDMMTFKKKGTWIPFDFIDKYLQVKVAPADVTVRSITIIIN